VLSIAFLNLSEDILNRGFREEIWVVFHILLSVLISFLELEFIPTKEKSLANQEIFLAIVISSNRVSVLLAFHELSSYSTRILVTDLIDLDGIISTIEGNDEFTELIIRLS
jgi:hypothetical protein